MEGVSLMSSSGGLLATECMKWKRFVRIKTEDSKVGQHEALACLLEGRTEIRDTLPDLKVRMREL